MSSGSRKESRTPIAGTVRVREPGLRGNKVQISDLSRSGCRLELFSRVKLHDQIWVQLPGLEAIEADVCWCKNFTAGVQFRRPLHPAVYQHLLRALSDHSALVLVA